MSLKNTKPAMINNELVKDNFTPMHLQQRSMFTKV